MTDHKRLVDDHSYDNPKALAEAILETIAAIHTVQPLYEAAIKKAKRAEAAYKYNRAKAYLEAEGPIPQREAERDVKVHLDHEIWLIAEGEMDAMKERVITLRGEMNALQSLLATQRMEHQASSVQQKYGI